MDTVMQYLKYLWKELLYMLIVGIYILLLNNLNNILLSKNLTNPIEILQYNNLQPTKYFVAAFLLFVIGIMLFISRVRQLKEGGIFEIEINGIGEILAFVCSIIIVVVALILIITYIQIPILQAVFGVIGLGAIMFSK